MFALRQTERRKHMLDRVQMKREAKQITKNACVSAYLFTLLYLAILTVLDGISTYVGGDIVAYMTLYFPELPVPAFLERAASIPQITVVFVTVMVSLLGSVLHAGNVLYHQGVRRGETMPFGTLFDGFSFVGKLIVLDIIMYVLIFLWSLLFVIPGIIAAYRYRFAVYNLCEDPELGVLEALRMSKVQTQGYKADLFILDLSFFGWSLLCTLTLGVLSIWVTPWMMQADMGYFEELKRRKGVGRIYADSREDEEISRRDGFDEL